jgi:hypothetical protein
MGEKKNKVKFWQQFTTIGQTCYGTGARIMLGYMKSLFSNYLQSNETTY